MQIFRAARTNPVMAEKYLDKSVFKAVMDANLPGSKAEKINLSAMEWVEAGQVRESLWGSGRAARKQIYARMDTAEAAIIAAAKKVAKYKGIPRGSSGKQAARRELIAARKDFRDAAHEEYLRLPEEVEAWKIGLETKAAVAERMRLDAAIDKARQDVAAAHEAFTKIDGPLMEQLADASATSTAAAQLAWERAINLERMKRNILASFIDKRNKLMTGNP